MNISGKGVQTIVHLFCYNMYSKDRVLSLQTFSEGEDLAGLLPIFERMVQHGLHSLPISK